MKTAIDFDYSIGDEVRILAVDRIARVTGQLNDSDGPQYRCVYWDGGTRRVEWLYRFEIRAAVKTDITPDSTIGFDKR